MDILDRGRRPSDPALSDLSLEGLGLADELCPRWERAPKDGVQGFDETRIALHPDRTERRMTGGHHAKKATNPEENRKGRSDRGRNRGEPDRGPCVEKDAKGGANPNAS